MRVYGHELVEAADSKIPSKTIARYGRVDLLCIDPAPTPTASPRSRAHIDSDTNS